MMLINPLITIYLRLRLLVITLFATSIRDEAFRLRNQQMVFHLARSSG
jgi:hypothetical protein